MVAGIILGVTSKEISQMLAPLGSLYMSLLGMCITPLLIVSISSSIASMLRNDKLSGQIKGVALSFPLGMLFVASFGLFLAYATGLGQNMSPEAETAIGKLMLTENQSLGGISKDSGFFSLLKMMIPENIFLALSKGNNLAVLFFSLVLGMSLGYTKHQGAKDTVGFLEVMYEAFTKMIGGIMYGLPFGLLCLFADHISHIGVGIVFAIGKLIIVSVVGCLILIAFSAYLIKTKLGLSYKDLFKKLKRPALVSFATGSSLASIPSILEFFDTHTNYSKERTHLFVPLSICLNSIGATLFVAMMSVYMMELYGYHLSVNHLPLLLFGSMFSAIAMSGAPGISALAMLGIVLTPLGVPLEPAILISLAVMPVTEGAITLANVIANIGIVSFLSEAEETTEEVNYEQSQEEYSYQIEA